MKKRISLLIIGAIILIGLTIGGIYLYQSIDKSTDTDTTSQKIVIDTTNPREISYKGKEGITALVLLQDGVKTEVSGTGEMSFIVSINDLAADSAKNEYWSFEVNGEPATVGAGSYITKDSDTITWKLSTF